MLRCEECGREARKDEESKGWRAFLAGDPQDDPPEVAVFCPECAEREFGEPDGE